MSKDELMDKVKGGWAGQTIGVTFGGPTEFRYRGTFIQDYENLAPAMTADARRVSVP